MTKERLDEIYEDLSDDFPCAVESLRFHIAALDAEIAASKEYKIHYDRLFSSGVLIPTEEALSQANERDSLKAENERFKNELVIFKDINLYEDALASETSVATKQRQWFD